MAYGMEFLQNLGGQAMNFAKANPALSGAVLGAGASALTGGKGKDLALGALGGGALGYGAGQGYLGQDIQSFLGQGGGANQATQGSLGSYDSGLKKLAESGYVPNQAESLALQTGYENLAPQLGSQNLLGQGLGFMERNAEGINTGMDLFKSLGEYQEGRETSKLSREQMDIIRRQNALREDQYNRSVADKAQMQSNISEGFNQSKLGSSYYSV